MRTRIPILPAHKRPVDACRTQEWAGWKDTVWATVQTRTHCIRRARGSIPAPSSSPSPPGPTLPFQTSRKGVCPEHWAPPEGTGGDAARPRPPKRPLPTLAASKRGSGCSRGACGCPGDWTTPSPLRPPPARRPEVVAMAAGGEGARSPKPRPIPCSPAPVPRPALAVAAAAPARGPRGCGRCS